MINFADQIRRRNLYLYAAITGIAIGIMSHPGDFTSDAEVDLVDLLPVHPLVLAMDFDWWDKKYGDLSPDDQRLQAEKDYLDGNFNDLSAENGYRDRWHDYYN